MKKQVLIFTTTIFIGLLTILYFSSNIGQTDQTADWTARYSFAENTSEAAGLYAENEAQRFRADFDENGVRISAFENDWKLDWQLRSIGRGAQQTRLENGATIKKGQRIEIKKSAILTEWFENQPDGLEQGFIVHEKPEGREKLRLVLTTGSLAKATDDGQTLELSNKENGRIMRYENLKVWDAENTILQAAMRVADSGEIFLEVEDARAVYPVTIDPKFVQAQKILTFTSAYYGERFAVSENWLAIGAPGYNGSQGYFQIVKRDNAGNWGITVGGDFGVTFDNLGDALAISGNTVAASAPGANNGKGEVRIYKYNGMNFVLAQTLTAPAADQVNGHRFGASLAMQGDTLVVGASGGSGHQAVYIYRDVSAFVFRKKIVPSDSGDLGVFGSRVRYSGNTIVVSGGNPPLFAPDVTGGAVYVFTGSDANWTQQARITTPGAGYIGLSFDLEGETLVLSEQTITPPKVHVYQRSGTFWINQQTLIPLTTTPTFRYGDEVAISGGKITVTDSEYSNQRGVVYLFSKNNGVWKERQKLQPADSYEQQRFGREVHVTGKSVYATPEDRDQTDRRPVYEFQLKQTVPADFDGDRKTDMSVFRPSTSVWYLRRSQNGTVASTQFGLSTDLPVPADYDGDGITDVAVFRPSNGVWYGIFSSTNTYQSFQFGLNGDRPVPGDYDGDGLADLAVFRPSNGTWYWQNSSNGQYSIETFGLNGDVPVPGDYDGDGITDKAIFRPSNGNWWMARSALGVIVATFGVSTDKPVPADFTGDGKTDVAIYRPASGEWFILRSEDYSYYAFPFGLSTDTPAPGDYDGDGRTDAAVFRPSEGVWYLQRSSAGFTAIQFGQNGDKPLPGLPN